MLPLINETCITIKQLKDFVKDLPEKNENGENNKILVENTNDRSSPNPARMIVKLNQNDLLISVGRD